jgi:chemotaxis protein methyltransferase CheR
VTPQDYDYFQNLLKERSGLVLSAEKQYLVESRLLPLVRNHGLADLSEMVQRLRRHDAEPLIVEVVEAMMTNETYFFRDKLPFELFRTIVMPALITARTAQRRIRIWCAASSTGQEPYSLAICLKELDKNLSGWGVEILATDLSTEVLEKAKAGVYTHFEVQRGLPIQYLVKYFARIGDYWQIASDIRAMVKFQPFNLLHDFAPLGRFDLVFCRNVLIYFDQPTKINAMERLARTMERDSYLVLGAAETVVGLSDKFKPLVDQRGLYGLNHSAKIGAVAAKPRLAVAGGSY